MQTFSEKFNVFEGDLYKEGEHSAPIRKRVSWHYSRIHSAAEFKATLRAGAYAWPGGYPLYFITDDGAALSFDYAKKNARRIISSLREKSRDGWRVVACEVNWEDGSLWCESGARIESAHAENEKEWEG